MDVHYFPDDMQAANIRVGRTVERIKIACALMQIHSASSR